MRLAVLGASVSAQDRRHDTGEPTGYCAAFRDHHLAALGGTELVQLTYPGNRFFEGATVRVLELAAMRPDVCILEPLVEDYTRGRVATDAEIAFVYGRIAAAGAVPLTLLLPDPARRSPHHWPTHAKFAAFCAAHGLPVVEVDLKAYADIEDSFRGVHTTRAGAEIYAAALAEGVARLARPDASLPAVAALAGLPATLHVNRVAMPALETCRGIELAIVPVGRKPTRISVIQEQRIGPHAPLIDVVITAYDGARQHRVESRRSVWDSFCHFTRHSYVTLADAELEAADRHAVSVQVSPEAPPYARCKDPGVAWPEAEGRFMQPIGAIHVFSTEPVRTGLIAAR